LTAARLLDNAGLAVVVACGALLEGLLRVTTTKAMLLKARHLTPLTTSLVAKVHLIEAIAQQLHAVATIVSSIVGLHRGRTDMTVAEAVRVAVDGAGGFERRRSD
jgi:hypothetical protein